MNAEGPLDALEERLGPEIRDTVQEWGEELTVLTFRPNKRGGDPVAVTPEGKAVFPDKYRGGDNIKEDETWVCSVSSKGGTTFFGAPLVKLDSAFFFDLLGPQVSRIVQVALEDHRDAIEPYIKSALDKQSDAMLKKRMDLLESEREDLAAQYEDLERRYEEARQKIKQAEIEVRALKENAPRNGGANATPTNGNGEAPEGFAQIPGSHYLSSGAIQVRRLREDELESDSFTADRYFGHVSPDRRVLFLKPHPNGNLPCVHHRIHIPGLNTLRPFGDDEELPGTYVSKHGGYIVDL
ncbi:MAG: hypothetical protein KY455_09150 [Euryarchaeota archaeon]|nr:hypothetical protein [Euryarchaeota archaeon]